VGGDEGEGELNPDKIGSVHPHPVNHVMFRALSCTLRGAGLILPHRRGRILLRKFQIFHDEKFEQILRN
jgi:hypothetical protein